MASVRVIARYTISDGKQEDVLGLLVQLRQAALDEPGCTGFDVFRQVGDDREIALVEGYASDEALAEHRASPHFTNLVLGQIVPQLDRREVEVYRVPEPVPDA